MSLPALKARLAGGAVTAGLWLSSGEPLLAEIAATAGFDWLLIDAEHGANDLRSVSAQLAVLRGQAVLVRPRDHDPAAIKQLLDAGAAGLMIPQLESAAQAEALVRAMRYPPRGVRGVGAMAARASLWGAQGDYLAAHETGQMLVVQVESAAALDALHEICAVEGVDGVFVGPSDLAADMGFLGQTTHPDVIAAVTAAVRAIRAGGKIAGVYASEPPLAAACRAAGAQMIAAGCDLAVLARGLRDLAEAARSG